VTGQAQNGRCTMSPSRASRARSPDNASSRDLEQMSTSTDGGLTWSAPQATADQAHGLGGQPLVQPDGRVIVPFEGISRSGGIRAFTSDDGGATFPCFFPQATRLRCG
jgi:Neuraminidase (sialidase)